MKMILNFIAREKRAFVQKKVLKNIAHKTSKYRQTPHPKHSLLQ